MYSYSTTDNKMKYKIHRRTHESFRAE